MCSHCPGLPVWPQASPTTCPCSLSSSWTLTSHRLYLWMFAHFENTLETELFLQQIFLNSSISVCNFFIYQNMYYWPNMTFWGHIRLEEKKLGTVFEAGGAWDKGQQKNPRPQWVSRGRSENTGALVTGGALRSMGQHSGRKSIRGNNSLVHPVSRHPVDF